LKKGSSEQSVDWKGVLGYVPLAYGISWAIEIGLRPLGLGVEPRATLGMLGPALAAIAMRLARNAGFANAAMAPRIWAHWRAYLLAYALTLGVLVAGSLISWMSGLQHWALVPNPLGLALSWEELLGIVLFVFTGAVPLTVVTTAFEEMGWRGYLLPHLLPLGTLPAVIGGGVIWGCWHAPLILLGHRGYSDWAGLGVFVLLICSYAGLISWLRLRTGSIWPGALAYAVINVTTSTLFVLFTSDRRHWGMPIGLLAGGAFALASLVLFAAHSWRRKSQNVR